MDLIINRSGRTIFDERINGFCAIANGILFSIRFDLFFYVVRLSEEVSTNETRLDDLY